MSMYMSVLGINIESYGHVLGPPRVSSNSEKKYLFPFFKPFFNDLIKKLQNVIIGGSRVRFWRGDARFHTQSRVFTPMATFTMFRAAKTSRKELFG